jgi:hypothetical protein
VRLPFTKESAHSLGPEFDAALTPGYFEAKKAEFDRILAETPPLPPIDDLLPLKDPGRRCPKCGSRAVTIEYHGGIHTQCPDTRMTDWGLSSFGLPFDPKHEARLRRISERAVEHHDRSCCNCKHRWVEDVRKEDER